MSAEADLDHPANQVSVNKRAFSNDELLEQLSKRALTNDELLEQLNQLRRELHKRGRSEAEVPPAPASSSMMMVMMRATYGTLQGSKPKP